jgi:hypothetical protein
MALEEEHERPEDMVEAPGEAERAARSLPEAADSNATLEGYYSINDVKAPEEIEKEVEEGKAQPTRNKARTQKA